MTFDVGAGEVLGFVGSNGAGRTMTMRIMLGALVADAGAVRWDGAPVTEYTRSRIGCIPEERGPSRGRGAEAGARKLSLGRGNQQRVQPAAVLVHDR